MASFSDVLGRLRDAGPDGAATRLAALLVDDALARKVGELVEPAEVAAALRDGIRAMTASDEAEKAIVREIERARGALAAQETAVSKLVPPALQDGARALAELPIHPRREAVLKLLDREPVRQLLRAQVTSMLVDFGRKATAPAAESPLGRGLGGLSKLAGKVAARPTPLGNLASAVSDQVEKQVEKRASEFADNAVRGILEGIAKNASDPSRAEQQAALRLALLDGALSMTGAELADLARGEVAGAVHAGREALAAWAADAGFVADVESRVRALVVDRTIGELLDDLALREPVTRHARAVVEKAIARVVASEAFAKWLDGLLSG